MLLAPSFHEYRILNWLINRHPKRGGIPKRGEQTNLPGSTRWVTWEAPPTPAARRQWRWRSTRVVCSATRRPAGHRRELRAPWCPPSVPRLGPADIVLHAIDTQLEPSVFGHMASHGLGRGCAYSSMQHARHACVTWYPLMRRQMVFYVGMFHARHALWIVAEWKPTNTRRTSPRTSLKNGTISNGDLDVASKIKPARRHGRTARSGVGR